MLTPCECVYGELYRQYRAWLLTPAGALEVLRAGVAPPVPFEQQLSSEAVGRDRVTAAALLAPGVADQAAAEEAAAVLAADRDAARRRADAAVAELVTAREEAVDLRGDLSRRAIDTAFQMGLRQVAEHRAGLLDRQLGACRLELDGIHRSFQAEQALHVSARVLC